MIEIHVTASVGISLYPGDGTDADSLLKNADAAMYQVKQNGREGYQYFEPDVHIHTAERQFLARWRRRKRSACRNADEKNYSGQSVLLMPCTPANTLDLSIELKV